MGGIMLTKIESACANTIINFFLEREDFITHMKVQKILYFSVGYCLANNNTYIVEHDFQAWPYGPVLPKLYEELKQYKDTRILELIKYEGKEYLYNEGIVYDGILRTIDKLKNLTTWELSERSHSKDGPWFKTAQEKGFKKSIDVNMIKNYFEKNPL